MIVLDRRDFERRENISAPPDTLVAFQGVGKHFSKGIQQKNCTTEGEHE